MKNLAITEKMVNEIGDYIIKQLFSLFDEGKWITGCLIFIIIAGLSVCIKKKDALISFILRHIGSFLKEPKLRVTPQFKGRENVIRVIYGQYYLTKGIGTILVCGLGGSGKTTICNNFEKVLLNAPRVCFFTGNNMKECQKNHSIIFVDYAYENIDSIIRFREHLNSNRKKKVLLVLLERTYAKTIMSSLSFDCTIDLNESEYTLSPDDIADIISFNISHSYDKENKEYISTKIEIDSTKAKELAEYICDVIDKKYHRPIFAYIVAELYRAESNREKFDLSKTESSIELLERYWKMKTRHTIMMSLIEADKKGFFAGGNIAEALNNVKRMVEILTLFCSMTKLTIEYDSNGVTVLKSDTSVINDERLCDCIKAFIDASVNSAIKRHLISKILDMELGTLIICENDLKMIIKPIVFDIVSTWLLGKTFNVSGRSKDYSIQLAKLIQNITDQNVNYAVISFVLRSLDENNTNILSWYSRLHDIEGFSVEEYISLISQIVDKMHIMIKTLIHSITI